MSNSLKTPPSSPWTIRAEKAIVAGVVVSALSLTLAAYLGLLPKLATAQSKKPSGAGGSTTINIGNQTSTGKGGSIINAPLDHPHFGDNIYNPPPTPTPRPAPPTSAFMRIADRWQAVTSPVLKPGDRFRVSATGTVQWGMVNQTSGPEGVPLGLSIYVAPPIPGKDRIGALIGRFGNGRPFFIGDGKDLTMQKGGLSLGVNDAYLANNKLGFTVKVQKLPKH